MGSAAKKSTKSKTAVKSPAGKSVTKKTSSGKVSAAKTASAPKPAHAATPAPQGAEPTLVNKPQPVVLGPVMRKKELIDTVVTRSGIKKKDAKPVAEAMLAVLGEALAEGRELILPPLGKVVVRKEKKLPRGKMMIVKVRQTTAPSPHEIAMQEDAQDEPNT